MLEDEGGAVALVDVQIDDKSSLDVACIDRRAAEHADVTEDAVACAALRSRTIAAADLRLRAIRDTAGHRQADNPLDVRGAAASIT